MATQKARLLRKGDIIKYTSGDREVEEVIRDVVIVLQMANGESLSVATTEEYTLIPQEVVPATAEEDAPEPPTEEEPAITGGTE